MNDQDEFHEVKKMQVFEVVLMTKKMMVVHYSLIFWRYYRELPSGDSSRSRFCNGVDSVFGTADT